MPPLSPFSRTCVALAIGQMMVLPTQAAVITVNSDQDNGDGPNCTLREAIVTANTDLSSDGCVRVVVAGTDTITFSGGLPDITLESDQTPITSNVVIEGPGAADLAIEGAGAYRVFAIGNSAVVSLNSLTIRNGNATSGAGLLIDGGRVTITGCEITGNSAVNVGGGIYADSSDSLTIQNSTLSGNSAEYVGGIFTNFSHSLSILNTTVTGNSGLFGGGMWSIASYSLSVQNSLLLGNRATNSSDEVYNLLGFSSFLPAPSGNLFGDAGRTSDQAFYNFTPSTGTNIVASSDSAALALEGIVDPDLADNGGPTLTHALVANSPAIDAADNANCPDTDQRSEPRDANCDIGAFEFIDSTCFVVKGAGGEPVVFCL